MSLDQFDPVDIELFEVMPGDYPEAMPVKPRYVKINGQNVLTSSEEGESVYVHPMVGDDGGCLKVTMTLFARSLKVGADRSGTSDLPSTIVPIVDARTATAEELNEALAERGWRLAFDVDEPRKPFIAISTEGGGSIATADKQQFTINAPVSFTSFPALVQGTWNDSGAAGVQEITVTGLDKTERLIVAMISHALQGQRVVYIADRFGKALDVQADIGKRWIEDDIQVYTAHGNQRIKFKRSGGEILFLANSKHSGRGLMADVLVLDGIDASTERLNELVPMLTASKRPYLYQTFNATPAEEVRQQLDQMFRDSKVIHP